ncbi:DUF5071 domain-containing protein [Anaerobacillus sp. MEB173]|uniref:DUF5071 domain-containing protein n=1 Tax=Anaerobacillus sp. MEB173 TaxID=3383345 RepID=UPI003F8FC636
MNNVESNILNLSWHKPVDVQEKAIKELSNLKGNEVVFLAKKSNELCSKECWQNASVVLKQIGYPNNKAAFPYLMEWFQDLNHPGVANIIDLLSEIDKNELKPHIEQAILKAMEEKDEDWGLGLLTLINELKITKYFDGMLVQDLKTLANYDDRSTIEQ